MLCLFTLGCFLVIIFAVVQNDLTRENVDVIVNAANSWLKHGGGVSPYFVLPINSQ